MLSDVGCMSVLVIKIQRHVEVQEREQQLIYVV